MLMKNTIDYQLAYNKLYSEVARMLVALPEEGENRHLLLHQWDSLRRGLPPTT